MAVTYSSRHVADEEARAEVDVLTSRLDKTAALTKKIQASLTRLETSGKSVQEAIGPIHGTTQRLQVMGRNIDNVLAAIDKIRQPSDIRNNEESIIRGGVEAAGLQSYLASMSRSSKALREMRERNMKSNEVARQDLVRLLQVGNEQLKQVFTRTLQEDAAPIEPLNYILKPRPFPALNQERTRKLKLVNDAVVSAHRQSATAAQANDIPTAALYASVRGTYIHSSLTTLAQACLTTAKKKAGGNDAPYKAGTNGIGSYAKALEGIYYAEWENITAVFGREDWSRVFVATTQKSMDELVRTFRELNVHIKTHLPTDCYLAYETMEIMSGLSIRVDERIHELKSTFGSALKPIRDTARSSLADLLQKTKEDVSAIQVLPSDAGAVPVTADTMTRLQTMVDFLRPISSIMLSLGDGNWKTPSQAGSSETIPSLASFDINADGRDIFGHYAMDTIEALLSELHRRGQHLLKSKQLQGVFLANNLAIVTRMIHSSELAPLLQRRMAVLDTWRKKSTQLYMDAWLETSRILMDVVHTSAKTGKPSPSVSRPMSGTPGTSTDSSAIVKALSSKERDTIKEKFKSFNATFEELVAKHKGLSMEREVREMFGREVQGLVEPLYGRFWERYHEIDRGRGKYIRWGRKEVGEICAGLAG
jgi:exocyst complex protein 7